METFCIVVLGGEYVMTYCWRLGVPTHLTFTQTNIKEVVWITYKISVT